MKIDVNAVRIVLANMPDGFIFEEFAQKILSIVSNDDFIPVGGSGDQGVDGYKRVFKRKKQSKLIYQISTEIVHWSQDVSKITSTQDKLQKNKISIDKLIYVTNRKIERKDTIIDNFYDKYKIPLSILDAEWFVDCICSYPNAAGIYASFVETYVSEYQRPTKMIEVGDFCADPRLYVFLTQHIDTGDNEEIENSVLDGLILFSLEGTSSDKKIFKSQSEILSYISDLTKFNLPDMHEKLGHRLIILSKKPLQKIKYHSKDKVFCLPHDTILELNQRDVVNNKLRTDFKAECELIIKNNPKSDNIKINNVFELFEEIIHKIYSSQGLEFSDFIIKGTNKEKVDDSLCSIVGKVVDDSTKKIGNKEKIKLALLISLREIAYSSSIVQRNYLKKLSKTYMMIFLTQNDPKINLFFKNIASKLDLFVGNSIIIPALSEFYLNKDNRRFWNLLKGARSAGVSLKVNEFIIEELVSHFNSVVNTYKSLYEQNEEEYLEDDIALLYIDEILIRAYFYAKRNKRITSFKAFINMFIDPSLNNVREDIINYLNDEFEIEYISSSSQNAPLDQEDVAELVEHLKVKKHNHVKKAEADAKLFLHIYKLREINNESNNSGIFGYKTWWLSQDINTYKSVKDAFGDLYSTSCYMRPDFVYKYISLSPKKDDIDSLYENCFPSLMGVNLSYHIPNGISEFVSQKIQEHKDTNPRVIKRTLRRLTQKLMTSIDTITPIEFKSYFEKELENIESSELLQN